MLMNILYSGDGNIADGLILSTLSLAKNISEPNIHTSDRDVLLIKLTDGPVMVPKASATV